MKQRTSVSNLSMHELLHHVHVQAQCSLSANMLRPLYMTVYTVVLLCCFAGGMQQNKYA